MVNFEGLKRGRSVFWIVGVGILIFGAPHPSLGDDLPIVLSNQNIGMSGAEIEASQAPAPPAPSPTSEFVSAEGPVPASKPKTSDSTPGNAPVAPVAPKAAPPVVSSHSDPVSDYSDCVEKAIRGGADYSASTGVCRALFPASAD